MIDTVFTKQSLTARFLALLVGVLPVPTTVSSIYLKPLLTSYMILRTVTVNNISKDILFIMWQESYQTLSCVLTHVKPTGNAWHRVTFQ